MVETSPTMFPSEAAQAGSPIDFATIAIVLIPLIIFIIVMWWGFKKKGRKQNVIELSYNLIALELLFFVIFPVCAQPFACSIWALIPIAMFSLLLSFRHHRSIREKQHKARINKAMGEGHVDATTLLQGKIEEDLHEAKKKEMKEKKEPKEEPKEKIEEKPRMPKPKKEPDHKTITKVIDKVINSNQ